MHVVLLGPLFRLWRCLGCGPRRCLRCRLGCCGSRSRLWCCLRCWPLHGLRSGPRLGSCRRLRFGLGSRPWRCRRCWPWCSHWCSLGRCSCFGLGCCHRRRPGRRFWCSLRFRHWRRPRRRRGRPLCILRRCFRLCLGCGPCHCFRLCLWRSHRCGLRTRLRFGCWRTPLSCWSPPLSSLRRCLWRCSWHCFRCSRRISFSRGRRHCLRLRLRCCHRNCLHPPRRSLALHSQRLGNHQVRGVTAVCL